MLWIWTSLKFFRVVKSYLSYLTFNQMTDFRLFQTERVCRWQFQIWRNGRKLSKRVENIVGKGEIAHYEEFLLFPQCFQKACFPRVSKGVIVWEWVNSWHIWLMTRRLWARYPVVANFLSWRFFASYLMHVRKVFSGLILYHKVPTFNDPKKEAFWKQCWKRRNCW